MPLVSLAQKDKDNIGTETVNVVKPYTPTISDAFKVAETPVFEDDDTNKKETINYKIVSIPVASTFTPTKGVAAKVEKTTKEILFDNYATLGFGSYSSIVAGIFVTHKLSDNEMVLGVFNHNSSQANIKNTDLNSKFYDTKLNVNYSNKQQDLDWNAALGYQNQVYNWFGLPSSFGVNLSEFDKANLIGNINPSHTFHDFKIAGNANFKANIFEAIGLTFNRFWDNYDSTENQFSMKPVFKLDVSDNAINLKTSIDYIATTFQKFYQANQNNTSINDFQNKNSYFSMSANPNFAILQDDLTVNVGAEFTFLNTVSNRAGGIDFGSKSNIYIYPKINASYKVVGDLMIAYGGAEGGLNHNSYRNLANQNNFLSPTLSLRPTDTQFDIYAGLRGKLADNLGYDIKASYLNEKNKALFRNNFYNSFLNNNSYENGNSFTVVYDDIRTIRFDGSLKTNISDKVDFGVHASFASFSNSFEAAVWNMPTLKVDANVDVKFTEKWSAGSKIFFVGERKDQIAVPDDTLNNIPTFTYQTVILSGFFDANLHINYRHNERITGFFRANNIGNQAYQRWLNFPVQQLQLVLGANYKFDF